MCLCILYVFLLSALPVKTWIPKTFSECLNNIKAVLLWVTPAVVIESWHYFTAWFYHSHQNLNREISRPPESDKSQRNCTVSLAAPVATGTIIQWLHWFRVLNLYDVNIISTWREIQEIIVFFPDCLLVKKCDIFKIVLWHFGNINNCFITTSTYKNLSAGCLESVMMRLKDVTASTQTNCCLYRLNKQDITC